MLFLPWAISPGAFYLPSVDPSGASTGGEVVSVPSCWVGDDCGAVVGRSRWYSGILAKSWA